MVPEELVPVQLIGKLTLNRNPTNYFAETEQVAFHPGHLVPGIEVTNDPLLQARLFSYLDRQLTRLGGPNFSQLPVNRSHGPVNDMLRDGMHQTAVHNGLTPYRPNSIDRGEPDVATAAEGRAGQVLPAGHQGTRAAGTGGSRRGPVRPGRRTVLVIAPGGGVLSHGARRETADRTLLTTRSVELDALVIAGGTEPATPSGDIKLTLLLQEAFRHCKTLAARGDGAKILAAAGIIPADPGIVTADMAVKAFHGELFAAMGLHRAWARAADVMASAVPLASAA